MDRFPLKKRRQLVLRISQHVSGTINLLFRYGYVNSLNFMLSVKDKMWESRTLLLAEMVKQLVKWRLFHWGRDPKLNRLWMSERAMSVTISTPSPLYPSNKLASLKYLTIQKKKKLQRKERNKEGGCMLKLRWPQILKSRSKDEGACSATCEKKHYGGGKTKLKLLPWITYLPAMIK